MTRSLAYCFAGAALNLAAVALAILTPATDANRKPMALLIAGTTFLATPALLIAAHRAQNR